MLTESAQDNFKVNIVYDTVGYVCYVNLNYFNIINANITSIIEENTEKKITVSAINNSNYSVPIVCVYNGYEFNDHHISITDFNAIINNIDNIVLFNNERVVFSLTTSDNYTIYTSIYINNRFIVCILWNIVCSSSKKFSINV